MPEQEIKQFVHPKCSLRERAGSVITISSGDLAGFPPWFVTGLGALMDRLERAAAEKEVSCRDKK